MVSSGRVGSNPAIPVQGPWSNAFADPEHPTDAELEAAYAYLPTVEGHCARCGHLGPCVKAACYECGRLHRYPTCLRCWHHQLRRAS